MNTLTTTTTVDGRPASLGTWHIATSDRKAARRFAKKLGSDVTEDGDRYLIDTKATEHDVIIDSLGGYLIDHSVSEHFNARHRLQPVITARLYLPQIDYKTPLHFRTGSWQFALATPELEDLLWVCGEHAYAHISLDTKSVETGVGLRNRRAVTTLTITGTADEDGPVVEFQTINIDKENQNA